MTPITTSSRKNSIPTLGLLLAAIAWGLFWVPVRNIQDAGIGPAWTSIIIFAGSCVVLLPLVLLRWRNIIRHIGPLLFPGLLSGLAFSLYTISINLTDVVRVVLLFYMTPLWSTLLGIIVLKEQLNISRVIALVLAFGGLLTILGIGYQLPIPRNIGDWLALVSGIIWAFASVKLFQGGPSLLVEKVFLFVLFALLGSLCIVSLPLGITESIPNLSQINQIWIWILIVSIVMAPMTFLTIWPATILSPARVGMLLMADVLAGVTSAALLTDETFGMREIVGTLLIVSAGVIEVTRQQSK